MIASVAKFPVKKFWYLKCYFPQKFENPNSILANYSVEFTHYLEMQIQTKEGNVRKIATAVKCGHRAFSVVLRLWLHSRPIYS